MALVVGVPVPVVATNFFDRAPAPVVLWVEVLKHECMQGNDTIEYLL